MALLSNVNIATRPLKALTQVSRVREVFRCARLTRSWRALVLGYVGFKRPPFEIVLGKGGFAFQEVADIATFWQIFLRDIYPVNPTDKRIIDAGANIGTFALYALMRAPGAQVDAIEPAPDSVARLRTLLQRHGMAYRCKLHQCALGPREGKTTIQMRVGSQFRRTGLTEGISVPMKPLDSFVTEEIDLLKIDVEGAEEAIFDAAAPATLRRIRRIAMEYHPQVDMMRIVSLLETAGFHLRWVRDDGQGYGIAWLEKMD